MRSLRAVSLIGAIAALFASGCSSSPPPAGVTAPANDSAVSDAENADAQRIVVGGADSVGSIPGSAGAQYVYVFKQTDPSSDHFTFQDRDLSFYFRPSPTVLHFQVENRQNHPIWIEWDRSTFFDSFGTPRRICNAETRWAQRLTPQPPTQIPGLQRHGNYVFPVDYLVDPGGSGEQLHRPLFPEDQRAPQFVDREFGLNLTFRLEDRLQPYTFRFRVRSVLPR